MKRSFHFVILSDTHIRSEKETHQLYPSDGTANERNEILARKANGLSGRFIIHLGDVVHPIRALAEHENAVKKAHRLYASLDCPLFVTPGNHDVGDKPNAWVPAPEASNAAISVFEKYWGPQFRFFDRENCRFVIINSSLLNSGSSHEKDQVEFLKKTLKNGHDRNLRIFVFTHYPFYIFDPNEPEHYDNIAEPARSQWLDLVCRFRVEAVFSGHAHTFFYNRLNGTDFYVIPSTTFVRPEFSELYHIPPKYEQGRYDPHKLSFCTVSVSDFKHDVRLVSVFDPGIPGESGCVQAVAGTNTLPAAYALPAPGVVMRHAWNHHQDLPCDSLDEFTRKRVRNDLWIPRLWDLGINKLKVPLVDLQVPQTRGRMAVLCEKGFEFHVFSTGVPSTDTLNLIFKNRGLACSWEVIVPEHQIDDAVQALSEFPGPSAAIKVFLSKIHQLKKTDTHGGTFFSHFPNHGFHTEDLNALARLPTAVPGPAADGAKAVLTGGFITGVTFEIDAHDLKADQQIEMISQWSSHSGTAARINLRFPRNKEGTAFDDDAYIAGRILEITVYSWQMAQADIYLDTFMDHDRGYNPRHGLVDRRNNPRPVFFMLANLYRAMAPLGPVLAIRRLSVSDPFCIISIETPAHRCVLLLPEKDFSPGETVYLEQTVFRKASRESITAIKLISGEPITDLCRDMVSGTGPLTGLPLRLSLLESFVLLVMNKIGEARGKGPDINNSNPVST